jgi:ABC-type transport system involved in cytochrome bd biosynthesis fused ATPase/permease subunit
MHVLADGTNYPLLNAFWTMLEFFLWILWFFLLFKIITDLFRSDDVSGWGKAGWTILLIILPFIGAFIYLIVRGGGMFRRDQRAAQQADQAMRSYIQSAAGTSPTTADELGKLAALRDQSVITAEEFEQQKAKLLA